MKLTPWFPCHVKPIYVGYYQRDYWDTNLSETPDYWDGEFWHAVHPDGARDAPENSAQDRYRWRGLAEDPNA